MQHSSSLPSPPAARADEWNIGCRSGNSITQSKRTKFPPLNPSSRRPARPPEPIVERIDVALIGAGRMGQVHGPNAALHPGLRLKYVVDPRPGAAAPLCERFGAAAAPLEQALAEPGRDRKSTRLNSSHQCASHKPSSA